MCIIIANPKGMIVNEDIIHNCYSRNRNGIGIAWANKTNVIIRKGLSENNLLKIMTDIAGFPSIIHFRFATHGNVDSGNCHPFPVSRSVRQLRATNVITDIAVAHNGIVPINPRKDKLSDTQEFIIGYLSKNKDKIFSRENKTIASVIHKTRAGKFVFLNNDGRIVLIGEFIKKNDLYFSNRDFEIPSWDKWQNYFDGNCEICGNVDDKKSLVCVDCLSIFDLKKPPIARYKCDICGQVGEVVEISLCKDCSRIWRRYEDVDY